MALPTQSIQIPLIAGLNQKADARAKQPPALDICKDVEFDDIGNLRTRKPFGSFPTTVIGSQDIADTGPVRRVVDNNGELLLFTQTALYSWVAEANAWALRDTHMAVVSDEEDVFSINGDQTSCDRAELNGVIMYAWISGGFVYVAARDKTTGAVVLAPTKADTSGHSSTRCRIVALQSRILLVFRDSTSSVYMMYAFDPAALAVGAAGSLGGVDGVSDLVAVSGTDTAIFAIGTTSTEYRIYRITYSAGLSVTTSIKARGGNTAIAIAVDPSNTYIQVVRTRSTALTAVTGDLLSFGTLADTAGLNQPIGTITGTTVTRITAAYRLVQNGGAYRCYIFWTNDETGVGFSGPSTLTSFQCKSNWADTGGTLGAEAAFVRDLGIAARAFAYGNYVYVVGVFAGVNPLFGGGAFPFSALQNTDFVYRDDARLVGKVCTDRSGGLLPAAAMLPGVTLTTGSTGYTFCATSRRIVPLNNRDGGNGYSGRAPTDVTLTFDDDRARRCVRIGKTMYVAGAQVLQYDGLQLSEVGFHIYPWDILTATSGAAGALSAGAYTAKATYKWTNAAGEVDRSTTAVYSSATAAASNTLAITIKPLYVTRKPATAVTIELWRTKVSPNADDPFFLVSGLDPSITSGTNCYLANDPTVTSLLLQDALADTVIANAQANPENGTVLESLAPPPGTILASNDTRLFMAGIPGQPNAVWYSKTRNDAEVVAFNDALTVQVPATGGDITALSFLNETLVVFRETAIYAFSGDGFDNSSNGQNYGPGRVIALDCGAVSAEAVVIMDAGILFKSSKGWYLLSESWTLQYVGGPVATYDSDDVYAMHVVTTQHQVRIVTDRRIIVYDYLVNQWGEWTEFGVSATMWGSTYVLAREAEVAQQLTTFAGITYGIDVETAWFKLNEQQGMGRVREVLIIGEWRGTHKLRVRDARDYEVDGAGAVSYLDDVTWLPTVSVPGATEQYRHGPSQQRCESFKVRITAVGTDGVSAPTTEAVKLSAVTLRVGVYPTPNRRLSAAQKG